MTENELIAKVQNGEEGHVQLPIDDCMSLAKSLVRNGYAVLLTGSDFDDEYRVGWIYAGTTEDLNYADRDNVVFGDNDCLWMLLKGDYDNGTK